MNTTTRASAIGTRTFLIAGASALVLAATVSIAQDSASIHPGANPLWAIDQHRTTVVERIVNDWGDKLAAISAGVSREQLREMLFAMRADQLLAVSLAGSLTGLRDVLAQTLTETPTAKPLSFPSKALGDATSDVVYTPVTPCRLVETRGAFAAVYQGAGAFTPNEVRNYVVQGGNGVCLAQLPAGLNPLAVQLQVFGIPVNSGSSGDIEVLPQGSSFGSTATLVYLGNVLIASTSTTARINLANNQIAVQVSGGGAHLAIDVVGYFKAPALPIDPRFGSNTSTAVAGNGRQCTLGEIILTAGYVANGIPAMGQILSIAQNTALFSLLGTLYGGNGINTFALPDLRNAAPNGLTYSICTIGIFPARS
jgi:hypothetical protein